MNYAEFGHDAMLIIPVENQINWRRPPWMTFLLMLSCFLVFTFYQSGDEQLMDDALDHYLAADLDKVEAPLYEIYLQRRINLEGETRRIHELNLLAEWQAAEQRGWVASMMLADRGFYAYLQENRNILWFAEERDAWLQAREPIQHDYIDQLSFNKLGLTPAHLSLSSLFSYQFLHGGWGHLIGNLLFLFLLGFTVEKALGPGRYLAAYLACGALSGVIYTLFTLGSQIPLVGASGSISGLMGMYVAIYGLQKIRFFYFAWVYFDYFRAPALALLPVWIGKEIFDHWFAGHTGVAYLAHAGGLAAGAGLILLLGKGWFQIKETFFEPDETQQDDRFTQSYALALDSVGRMEFDQASRQFEALWERYPDRFILLEHLYRLAKLRPGLPEYQQRTRQLMAQCLKRKQFDLLTRVWTEYQTLAGADHPLPAQEHSRILFISIQQGNLKVAEKAFERLRASDDRVLVEEACRVMISELEKHQMSPKANQYKQILANLS